MTLNNIKSMRKDSGFTIVELLIVIVVIAILAAITIVAYNGIQNRAKQSSAQSLANAIVKKGEAYNTIQSAYPTNVAAFASGPNESILDDASKVSDVTKGSATGFPTDEKKVGYVKCTAGNTAQVIWRDAVNSNYVAIGLGGATSGVVTAACA